MSELRATAFAPATVGNVGPGFDVLGLAVEGLGDRVTVELTDGPSEIAEITGRDAAQIPREPERNAAAIAALAMLARLGVKRGVRLWIEKGLPVAGGLGGSAASSVAGAVAAHAAADGAGLARRTPGSAAEVSADAETQIIEAALAGESAVAGRHLDNIAPCLLGGLVLARSADPIDLVRIPVAADWWLALVTPAVRVETRAARAVLPDRWERSGWLQQMANTASLVYAFACGDSDLLRRALVDLYAEPLRAPLIPHFAQVQSAALAAGALACTISGSGPTVFALATTQAVARACGDAMVRGFAEVPATVHIGRIARDGARAEKKGR